MNLEQIELCGPSSHVKVSCCLALLTADILRVFIVKCFLQILEITSRFISCALMLTSISLVLTTTQLPGT